MEFIGEEHAMKKEAVIIIADDDEGHASLIRKNLRRAGLTNEILHFKDGIETVEFLFDSENGPKRGSGDAFVLLLDIRMPKMDGVEVLRRVRTDDDLRGMPVIMITTTDDPREIQKCHELGCNNYLSKPIDYDKFVRSIRQLGLFLLVVEIPTLRKNAG